MSGHCEICGQTGCVDCEPTHATGGDALTAYTEASQSLGQRVDDPNPLAKNAPSDDAGRVGKVVAWAVSNLPNRPSLYGTVCLSESGAKAYAAHNDRVNHIVPLVLASDLNAVTAELEKEKAQSQHLAEAVSRKIDELIAAENQCSYYRMQYTRAEQIRKEACEANAKAQAKMLWQEDALAAKEQECESLQAQLSHALMMGERRYEECERLRGAVRENHQWHLDYDEYEGYKGSALYETNVNSLEKNNGT